MVGQLVNSGFTEDEATRIANTAYGRATDNLARQRADFDAIPLPSYERIDPSSTAVPDTELKGIQLDPAGRQAQLEQMSGLRELIDSGGLSLADMKALNDVQGNLNQNAMARRKGLENQYAARGQLGSGAQLAMELQGAQDDAMRANDMGESVAAQAQARARQAMAERASLGRTMTMDKYGMDANAAKAADLIKARNMSARTDAIRGNNAAAGQGFDDRMAVAKGKNAIGDAERSLMLGQGQFGIDQARARGGFNSKMIDKGIGQLGGSWNGLSGSGGDSTGDRIAKDESGERGGFTDLSVDDEEK